MARGTGESRLKGGWLLLRCRGSGPKEVRDERREETGNSSSSSSSSSINGSSSSSSSSSRSSSITGGEKLQQRGDRMLRTCLPPGGMILLV
ncbi:hypothetical protein K0M31_017614 [Melipona bicolor]|uniref:Uncharacterized protein n=1 Tax=Melipona bicolor TaxID=60889 RepID=A0AA40G5E6_9HYME|nr:hypothetical protein K0M31_017614 [Melipona bicolor]